MLLYIIVSSELNENFACVSKRILYYIPFVLKRFVNVNVNVHAHVLARLLFVRECVCVCLLACVELFYDGVGFTIRSKLPLRMCAHSPNTLSHWNRVLGAALSK